MKLTKRQLKRIIKEEKKKVLKEMMGSEESFEEEQVLVGAAIKLYKMGYTFDEICTVVDEALQDPYGNLERDRNPRR